MTSNLYSSIDPPKFVYNGNETLLVQDFIIEQGSMKLIDYAKGADGIPAPVADTEVGNEADPE